MLLENTLSWLQPTQEICLRRPDEPAEPDTDATAAVRAVVVSDEDSALAEACRSGSLSAYERLYQTHGARMKSIARNLLGNAPDAEDAVQDVFLKIHRSIGTFKGQSAFSTWIYRILLNSCYDIRRKRQRRQETPELDLDPEGVPEPPAPETDHPLRLALERLVAQLQPRHRRVFLLAEVEGFKHAEIAAMLYISEAASKNVLYQAKRELRNRLLNREKPARADAP